MNSISYSNVNLILRMCSEYDNICTSTAPTMESLFYKSVYIQKQTLSNVTWTCM